MRRRRLLEWFRVTALIAALLVAQASTLAHSELDEGHPAGDACVLCVGLSTLGAANVGTTAELERIDLHGECVDDLPAYRAVRRLEHHAARAPPLAS